MTLTAPRAGSERKHIDLETIGRQARQAASVMELTTTEVKNRGLRAAADALEASSASILAANDGDVRAAIASGTSSTLVDRLTLTPERVKSMASGLRMVASLPDPVGETIDGWTRPNGLEILRKRVPLGVIAVIYEARPNVTSDVIGLCLKSGNATLLRGSASAARSNRATVDAILPALEQSGLPTHAIQMLTDYDRVTAQKLMRMRGVIDLLIPRGGRALIEEIQQNATVPYVVDGDGNCHVYVDSAADLEMARAIVVNAKTSRASVCNSAEKLLVHEAVAPRFVPIIVEDLTAHGVTLRGDERSRQLVPGIEPATEADWPTEYLDMTMAIKIVDDVTAAVSHVRAYGSGHTESIVTGDITAAREFISGCPSAVVMVNASTRFTDGGEFGFGAEIGNSTQRLHARGPMGLRELTTYRYEVWGNGHVR